MSDIAWPLARRSDQITLSRDGAEAVLQSEKIAPEILLLKILAAVAFKGDHYGVITDLSLARASRFPDAIGDFIHVSSR